ncbi:MAG: hypothetical protein QE279_03275 [Rhodoferax sp.]|nr:hypothetical protein [Rhodoferax sp.]
MALAAAWLVLLVTVFWSAQIAEYTEVEHCEAASAVLTVLVLLLPSAHVAE